MKKFAAGLIAVAMSVTMLAGCGVPANTVHSVDDLEGKTIGVQLGTTGDIYAEDVKDAKVEKYNKGADAVQALKQGKIDAVIIDAEPAKVFVEKNDDLEILDEPFAEEEYAIAMKLDNTELQTAVNGALKELKADVGVAGMTVTPDREKNVLFSDTYTSSSQVIIVRKK